MATTAKGFDIRLCEKLGVDPKRVNSITITLEPRDIVMLDIKMYATPDDLTEIIDEICLRLDASQDLPLE